MPFTRHLQQNEKGRQKILVSILHSQKSAQKVGEDIKRRGLYENHERGKSTFLCNVGIDLGRHADDTIWSDQLRCDFGRSFAQKIRRQNDKNKKQIRPR
jgi:hypothetical protein